MSEFHLLSDERIIEIRKETRIAVYNPWADTLALSRAIESESRAPLLAEIERLAREQSNTQARLDRAIIAAEEHFGEDAVRYKLSLSKNGRPLNCFPSDMDGKWFAFQRADDDAHVGLSLRCLEVEIERNELREQVERLKADAEASVAVVTECRDALAEELSAWDIEPPIHHIDQAHKSCVAWLAAWAQGGE
jgi:hypothetical protein